jgi:hypothetical protein
VDFPVPHRHSACRRPVNCCSSRAGLRACPLFFGKRGFDFANCGDSRARLHFVLWSGRNRAEKAAVEVRCRRKASYQGQIVHPPQEHGQSRENLVLKPRENHRQVREDLEKVQNRVPAWQEIRLRKRCGVAVAPAGPHSRALQGNSIRSRATRLFKEGSQRCLGCGFRRRPAAFPAGPESGGDGEIEFSVFDCSRSGPETSRHSARPGTRGAPSRSPAGSCSGSRSSAGQRPCSACARISRTGSLRPRGARQPALALCHSYISHSAATSVPLAAECSGSEAVRISDSAMGKSAA